MSKKIIKGVIGVVMVVGGVLTANPALIAAGVGQIAGAVLQPSAPKISKNATDRLNASLVPDTPRKIWFGHTAGGTDVRYQGYTGSDQEYVHWILAQAAHESKSIDELWFDTKKAWSAAGGVTSDFSGYLTVEARNPGASGNGIAIDGVWTATATLTGCAYLHIRFKTTGNSKKAESPFSSSLPSRVTVRGKGALLPDIRESGCEADDQSTWEWFDDDSGRNPALQLLFYLVGWTVNGRLSVGRGIPVDRLDLDSFITAANFCDESVSLAAGGTEPRYRSDGLFSEGDDPALVIGNLTGAMNAVMRDIGGRLSVHCLHNTLASPVAAFDETDILGEEQWAQTAPVDEYFNLVRGRYTDPSDASLYQLVDYPEIEIDSPDGIERAEQFDLACVQSASQAQRLAKQRLQRNLYRGTYSAQFNERAWQINLGDVVTLSHLSLGWDEKLFRVVGHGISLDGVTSVALQEEHEDIYAWEEEESAAVVAAEPTAYNALNSPLVQAIGDIDDAVSSILDAIADNVLNTDEKKVLVNDVATLEARYNQLVLRADDIGIDTSPATAAEDSFTTYLAALTPPWNDLGQDTTLAVSLAPSALSDWTGSPTPPVLGTSDIYTTVQDNSAVAFLSLEHTVSATPGQTISVGFVIARDAVAGATRMPVFALGTATGAYVFVRIDTSTGAFDIPLNTSNAGGTGTGACVALNDSEWLVSISRLLIAGDTSVTAYIYPGYSIGLAAGSATAQGTIFVRDPALVVGGFDELGRDAFRYHLKEYGAALDALDKAISEKDGVTALKIDGPAVIDIPATYTGDWSALLPFNVNFTAEVGGTTVTPTGSSVTTSSGTATATFTAGVLSITGPTTPSLQSKLKLEVSYAGETVPMTVTVNRKDADPPSGGGGGGTSNSVAVDATINSTTFTTIATIIHTAAAAAPALNATDLEIYPITVTAGTSNLEFKWVRENGVTDVDIGSTANSNPDPTVPGSGAPETGNVACSAADSGRSVGVAYTYYLQAKNTSGTRSNRVVGTAVVSS